MIEIMSESKGRVLGVRLTEKVSDKDYMETFIPALEKLIAAHGKIRCLYFMDDDFQGWDIGAMWDDAKFGLKHKDDFDKLAVVGGPKWAEWGTKLVAHLLSGEVKTYPNAQLNDAWKWIEA